MKRNYKNILNCLVVGVLCVILTPLTAGDGKAWLTDYDHAVKKAKEESKEILIDFTGSDWCSWCIRLDKEIFEKENFVEEAGKHFVLLRLDFPKDITIISEGQKKKNEIVKEKMEVTGFPSVFLCDSEGVPYAKTGYKKGGVENYLKELVALRKIRVQRDAAINRAKAVNGKEKAAALDEVLQVLGEKFYFHQCYSKVLKELLDLDKDNDFGFKKKYEELYSQKKIKDDFRKAKLLNFQKEPEKAIALLDKMRASYTLSPYNFQLNLLIKSHSYKSQKNLKKALACLEEALALEEETELTPVLKRIKAEIRKSINEK